MQASHRPPTRLRTTWGVVTQNWFAPLAVLVAVFDLLLVVNALAGGESVESGDGVLAFVLVGLAASIVGGLWMREHAGRRRVIAGREPAPGRRVGRLAAVAVVLVVALALLTLGVSGGAVAPFFAALALLAVTLVLVGGRLVVRAVRSSDPAARSALADAMIIVGVLPALAFWWAIVPTVIAAAVIVGVLTTNPRVRPAA